MSHNKRDSLTDAQLDEVLARLMTPEGMDSIAKDYGLAWDTIRLVLEIKRGDTLAEVMVGRRSRANSHTRNFSDEVLVEALHRLRQMESRDAIAITHGCAFDTIGKRIKARYPVEYAAVMDMRSQKGKTKGGDGRSKQEPHVTTDKKGGGFKIHLRGSGIQPLPNGMGESPRWPVRRKRDFSSLEIAELTTRLLGRLRTA